MVEEASFPVRRSRFLGGGPVLGVGKRIVLLRDGAPKSTPLLSKIHLSFALVRPRFRQLILGADRHTGVAAGAPRQR